MLWLATLPLSAFADELCADSTIIYKFQGKITKHAMKACKNQHGQFYSPGCQDGCKFRKIIEEKSIKESESQYANPGAGVCKKMGFVSFVSDIHFGGSTAKKIELCFDENRQSFVSKALLADLVYEINEGKNSIKPNSTN